MPQRSCKTTGQENVIKKVFPHCFIPMRNPNSVFKEHLTDVVPCRLWDFRLCVEMLRECLDSFARHGHLAAESVGVSKASQAERWRGERDSLSTAEETLLAAEEQTKRLHWYKIHQDTSVCSETKEVKYLVQSSVPSIAVSVISGLAEAYHRVGSDVWSPRALDPLQCGLFKLLTTGNRSTFNYVGCLKQQSRWHFWVH